MIVQRKFALPHLPAPFLDRHEAVGRLSAGLSQQYRATIARAGPGMGKTSLLAAYARRPPAGDDGREALVAWYGLTQADRDPAVFFRHLFAALSRAVPHLADQSREVAETLGKVGFAQAASLLCDDLEAALDGRSILLILDDAQLLPEDDASLVGCETLIRFFPETSQLVLAGRSLPPVKLAQFEVRGHLLALGDDFFRFSKSEVADLAGMGAFGDVPEAAIGRLGERTGGWPAGLVHALRAGGAEFDHPEALYSYLGDEVLDRLPADRFAGLAALAFLGEADGDACRALLGPRGRDDFAGDPALAAFLARDGDLFAMQPIFREAVQRRVLETWAAEESGALFRRLAALAKDSGDTVDFLQRAQNWDEAEHKLLAAFGDLSQAGRLISIRRLLEAFPADRLERSAGLRYMSGELERLEGRLTAALPALKEAEGLAGRDAHMLGRIYAALAATYGARGEPEQQREFAEKALGALPPGDHATAASCLNVLGMYHVYRFDADASRRCFAEALERYGLAGHIAGQMRVRHNMGLADARVGDFPRAISHYQEALRIAQAGRILPPALTYNNLALSEIYLGRLAEAGKPLEQGMALAERLMAVRDRAVLLRTMGRLYLASGAIPDAGRCFEEAIAEAQHAGDRLTQMYGHLGLAECRLLEDQPRQAEAAVERAMDAAATLGDAASGDCGIMRARVAGRLGRFDEAAERLADVERALKAAPSPYSEFERACVAAHLAAARGDLAAAAALESKVEALSADYGFVKPACDAYELPAVASGSESEAGSASESASPSASPSPSASASAAAPAPELSASGPASGRDDRRGSPAGTASAPASAPSSAPASAPASGSASTVRKAAITTFLKPPLEVRSFGAFQVNVDGRPVAAAEWKSAKAKVALVYLLLHPGGATKEALLEALYPNEDPARTAVNMTLSRLRQALEPNASGGDPSRFVLFQDGRYRFNQGVMTIFDAVDFRDAINKARSAELPAERRAALYDQALALYHGPFMEGFDLPWFEATRESYRRQMVDAFNDLFSLAGARDDWSKLGRDAERLLEREPASQEGHRARILSLALQERRDEALRACEHAREVIAKVGYLDLDDQTAELVDLVSDDTLTMKAARALLS